MLPKPEFPPLLAPGLITHSADELQTLTVGGFPASSTRKALWESFHLLLAELRNHGLLPAKLWLDGSFLTAKIEPDDIDLCIEIDADRMNSASPEAVKFLTGLAEHALHDAPRKLHTFLIPSAPAGHPDRMNYLALCKSWERDLGTALISKEQKGIALMEVPK